MNLWNIDRCFLRAIGLFLEIIGRFLKFYGSVKVRNFDNRRDPSIRLFR